MPTIPLEEDDYVAGSGALAGERIFKNADPATTFQEESANTLWHGLRNLVKQEEVSGDLTAADYATDLAAGFPNLAKAIRRAAKRFQSDGVETVQMSSPGYTHSLSREVFAYIIADDVNGPYDGGAFYPDTSVPAENDRRIILIINGTDSKKIAGDSSTQQGITLFPGEACAFFATSIAGPATLWIPIGRPLDYGAFGHKTLLCKLYNGANGTEASAAFALAYEWVPNRRTVTIHIPSVGLTVTTGGQNYLTIAQSDASQFPTGLRAYYLGADSARWYLKGTIDSADADFGLIFNESHGGQIEIYRTDGAVFSGGEVVTLESIELMYLCK